jgi:serine protease Do
MRLSIFLTLFLWPMPVVFSAEPLNPGQVPEIVKKAQESVVAVETNRFYVTPWVPSFAERFLEHFYERSWAVPPVETLKSEGSGVLIDEEGLVLTNDHVVSGATQVAVVLKNGERFAAEIVGENQKEDLALLKISGPGKFQALPFGDSDAIQPGEEILALGNPYGYQFTVTRGVVSAKDRELKEGEETVMSGLIQTDAALNPGSSGGPLLDAKGEMVGLVTVRDWRAQGIGFAVPVNRIKTLLPELRTGQEKRARLAAFQKRFGFFPELARDAKGGKQVLLNGLIPSSDAGKAGLRTGDVLVHLNGRYILSPEDALEEAAGIRAGARVKVRIERKERVFFTYIVAG